MTPDLLTRSMEQRQQRLSFMEWPPRGEGVYVAPFTALISEVLPPDEWRSLQVTLRVGEQVDRELLLERLIRAGYEGSPD